MLGAESMAEASSLDALRPLFGAVCFQSVQFRAQVFAARRHSAWMLRSRLDKAGMGPLSPADLRRKLLELAKLSVEVEGLLMDGSLHLTIERAMREAYDRRGADQPSGLALDARLPGHPFKVRHAPFGRVHAMAHVLTSLAAVATAEADKLPIAVGRTADENKEWFLRSLALCFAAYGLPLKSSETSLFVKVAVAAFKDAGIPSGARDAIRTLRDRGVLDFAEVQRSRPAVFVGLPDEEVYRLDPCIGAGPGLNWQEWG